MTHCLSRREFCAAGLAIAADAAAETPHRTVRLSPSGGNSDEAAIRRAFDEGALAVVLAAGRYRLSAPIELGSGQRLGGVGAELAATAAPSGLLRTHGAYIILHDGSRVEDLRLLPAPSTAQLSGNPLAAMIFMRGSDAVARRLTVEAVPVPSRTNHVFGLAVVGAPADRNLIEACTFIRCGVQYSYEAARGTHVIGCTVIRAPANAIGGACTSETRAAEGHVVKGNRIFYPARMGIEDFSRPADPLPKIIRGTHIIDNLIICNARSRPQFFAISAVGLDTLIEGNVIENWSRDYCIELGGGRGAIVRRNTLRWTDGNPYQVTGVQVQKPAFLPGRRVAVVENRFLGPHKALHSRGQDVLFGRNVVVDPKQAVADYETGMSAAEITGNTVSVSVEQSKGVSSRTLFNLPGRAAMSGNHIRYTSGALRLGAREIAIVTGGDGSVFTANSIELPATSLSGPIVTGITTNGQKPVGLRISGMRTSGSVVGDYANMIGLIEPTLNQWSGGVRRR